MGTAASLTFGEHEPHASVLVEVERIFAEYDKRFSLYRPSSELSRIASAELAMMDASEELRDAYALALSWRESTRNAFNPHRPDGVIDLSGVVKALAMQAAADVLRRADLSNFCLNVGGDIVAGGESAEGLPWSVGIVDPLDRSGLLTSISLAPGREGCATSGSAERGDHIWRTAESSGEFVQATVVADDIVTADVLATAIISGGPGILDLVTARWPVDVMTVDLAGAIRMTPGMSAAMLADLR
jgi:thiamine biosynthesis lipoprotein